MVEIFQKEDKILRQKSKEVSLKDIKGTKIRKIVADMKEALDSQEDGVAIAAPQIGELLRIFVISGRVMNIIRGEMKGKVPYPDTVFINPKITKRSREKMLMEEGCLSARWLYGKVRRSKKVVLGAYDEEGNFFTKGASGLMAQIFQHETDHLEGILFLDSAIEVEDIPPEKLHQRHV
ncbi:MAG: peptide deformylase [Candidatus Zambryskibacteria bacterium RIFCSPHIGHO2_01_FULL_43_25]|uniref:Peptide deformylase n=1 Tax=Candidatus Zambryskibacteria bacterium RIFCSPLOWO2_01_FULL_45_21 TaxID=1802761 RepID=A0A1G2U4V2_9BACT|nr:MAG: peptide deformylase [Candidatus Zambryskibacteria bacterium RIFCSPHIGHO2_01_FULL_43_25]OHB01005.1 MAG: peptide deformylase [Candidatus Zambryskibacteria bacterium RIFCSPHIGHO2_12_FULL_44_12b]OHB03950.1 MAG: peptide deformylase [Candidatus Zambryskibacteria bacterium RIFCSPLOWO2_01_FULL_45_21]